MAEWQQTTVGDFCPFLYGKGLPERARKPGAIPVVSSAGIIASHEVALVKTGGIVIGRKGTVGSLCLLNKPFWPIDTAFYVPDEPDTRDLKFTFYLLKTLSLDKMNSDSAVPGLNRDNAHQRKIATPLLAEQRTIAKVLGALDDKIELNRQMNETLEAMARALFKSWFVDFDPVRAKMEGRTPDGLSPDLAALFPDTMIDSPLGQIPKGWDVAKVEDISKLVAMGPFGSSIKVSTFVEVGIPVISGQHLHEIMLSDGDYNFVSEEHAAKLKNANVQKGDIVFTHAGSIGQVSYIHSSAAFERYVLSQRQFYLRCDDDKISRLFMLFYFKSHEGQHRLLANASQTG
ncbi:MAG: restriction endonuclease subunit S, partial [Alphaproteobacteria bacterium]